MCQVFIATIKHVRQNQSVWAKPGDKKRRFLFPTSLGLKTELTTATVIICVGLIDSPQDYKKLKTLLYLKKF